jgi:hypothetical protein
MPPLLEAFIFLCDQETYLMISLEVLLSFPLEI